MSPSAAERWPPFGETLARHGLALTRTETLTLQVNVGRLCNLACRHCHLEAGPNRREVMRRETMDLVVACAARFPFAVIDVTGGAPELNPGLLDLLTGLAPHTPRLLLRSNLVALADANREALIDTCQRLGVVIVASFPAINEAQAESQRGSGVFRTSLAVLKRLNDLGYGQAGSGLELDLVANPTGAFMPATQEAQTARFREVLGRKWGLVFNHLFSFVNVPLGRFKAWLEATGNYEAYMERLVASFNPCSLAGVMCRGLLSVAWDGGLYDCDFNQALDLPLAGTRRRIDELVALPAAGESIALSDHCYACTAGSGFT